MLYQIVVSALLGVLTLVTVTQADLRIGAFNIKTFGVTKYGKENIMSYIVQILQRYDMVLVQEIRDASGVVIPGTLARLNARDDVWGVRYSERLGRTSYKEQYAYYYRKDKLSVISEYQYDDGVDDGSDVFMREPYGVLFGISNSDGLRKFGVLGIHTSPDSANQELNGLDEVYEAAASFWNTQDIFILGDFNADCSYMSSSELERLGIRQPGYEWLIGDEVDTTSSTTNCAYDRIVAAGSDLIGSLEISSAQTYRFDDVLQLDYDTARDVSDHYPVEVTITTGRVNLAVPISSGIEVRSEIPAAANMLTAVNSLTSNPLIVSYFNILQLQIDNR